MDIYCVLPPGLGCLGGSGGLGQSDVGTSIRNDSRQPKGTTGESRSDEAPSKKNL